MVIVGSGLFGPVGVKVFKAQHLALPVTISFELEGNSTFTYISFLASLFPADYFVLTSCDIFKTLVSTCKPEKSLSAEIFFLSPLDQSLNAHCLKSRTSSSLISAASNEVLSTTVEVIVAGKLGYGSALRAHGSVVHTLIKESRKRVYHGHFSLESYRKSFILFFYLIALHIFT